MKYNMKPRMKSVLSCSCTYCYSLGCLSSAS